MSDGMGTGTPRRQNKALAELARIPKRVYDLVVKLISVKGLILGLATWLLYADKVDQTTWLLAAAGVIGTRAFEKLKSANK